MKEEEKMVSKEFIEAHEQSARTGSVTYDADKDAYVVSGHVMGLTAMSASLMIAINEIEGDEVKAEVPIQSLIDIIKFQSTMSKK